MNQFTQKNKSLLLKVKFFLNALLGFDLVKYPTPSLDRRIKFLKNNHITCVLDVGANIGQFAKELRSIGYQHKIISFEPTREAFLKLKKNASGDKNWIVMNCSLGDFDGEAEINISKNSVSSSLLDSLPQLTESAPDAVFVGKEKIEVKKLDSLYSSLGLNQERVFLKIDTQGYEEKVIDGSKNSLNQIVGVQIEMALVNTYQGSLSFEEMSKKLQQLNFNIFSIESGYYDKKTGALLEVDGVFKNNSI